MIVMFFLPGLATFAVLCSFAFYRRRQRHQNPIKRGQPRRARDCLARIGEFCGWFFGGLFTGAILGLVVGAAFVFSTGGSLADQNPHGGGQMIAGLFTIFGIYGGLLSGFVVGFVSLCWK